LARWAATAASPSAALRACAMMLRRFLAGFLDQLGALLLGTGTQLGGGFAGLLQFIDDLLLGERQVGFRLVRSR
jgi:hypothetical protein